MKPQIYNGYFKILGKGHKSCNGGDSLWRPGIWQPKVSVDPCYSGYHLCRAQDLIYWLNDEIWEAEGRGEPTICNDKVVFPEARITRRVKTWDETTARLLACWCARKCWSNLTDERSKNAIRVAERFAKGKATMAELSAAWSAAWSAAESAAESAARSAAWSAAAAAESPARSAAWSAARSAARSAAAAAAAAESAARSAAWSAAESAQTKKLLKMLKIEVKP